MALIKNFLLIVCTALFSIFVYEKMSLIDAKGQLEKNMTKFIQTKGMDELVITEITTNESFLESLCTAGWVLDFCLGRGTAHVSFDAHYKYHVKLNELKYTLEDDTLVFKVPDLILSTPVGFDNQKTDCDTTVFGSCGKPYSALLPSIPGYLERKGMLGLQNAFENAAKSLADDFFAFANNNNALFFKRISVIFQNEHGKSSRDFSYSSSYCGKEACNSEIKLNNFILTFK